MLKRVILFLARFCEQFAKYLLLDHVAFKGHKLCGCIYIFTSFFIVLYLYFKIILSPSLYLSLFLADSIVDSNSSFLLVTSHCKV